MAKRIGGSRRKSRGITKKPLREKRKFSISKYLQVFKVDDRVILKMDPGYTKSSYHRRFHGRIGHVVQLVGGHFKVEFKDGGKAKRIVVHPVHLKRA